MLLYLTNIGDILAKSFKYLYSRAYRCGGSGSGGGSSGSGVGGGGGGGSQDSYKRRRGNENYRAHHMVAQNSPNKHNAVTEAPLKDKVGVGMVTEDEVRIETIPDAVMEEDEYEKPVVTVPITLCLLILTGYIILGASIFMVWEGWSFLDSSYFCFVTLSTIGFGDLVPGDNVISNDNSQEKLVLCSLYLLVGMAVIAMCFNLMQEEVIHKVRNFGMKIGIIKAQEDEVD